MQDNNLNYENIPLEKFEFVHDGDRISDKKFEDKPIRMHGFVSGRTAPALSQRL